MRFKLLFWLFVIAVISTAANAVSISSLSTNNSSIGRYERYEVTFNLTGVSPSNYNPFRPETIGDSLSPAGIDVWAEVTTPSGKVQKVVGFWDVGFQYLGNSSTRAQTDRFIFTSAPRWKVRYAPMEVGSYRMTVKVKDSAGTASSSQLTFNCFESGKKGFIKVASDGSRFVFSDGSPYVPFGAMMPYGTDKIATFIPKMKANGMNFLRRWLVNRDQEDIFRNLEGWTSYSNDTSTYRSGKRSATKSVSGSGTIVDQSFLGCKPNTYYKAYCYIKTSSSFNGTAAVFVNEARADGSSSGKTGNTVGSNKDWTYSEVIFKTAANAEMLHFKPRVVSGSSGTVWVDDAGLYECDSTGKPTVDFNTLFNPSLEEWTPAQLRLLPLVRLEHLLEVCEANDIYVQPCFFDYRLWNKSSPTGLYASYFGDWWTDSASIAQQERALRYLVARFGAYRSVFAWELTNEMDSSYSATRATWIRDRANFIRQNDPHGHMITNSHWSSPADVEFSQIDELDMSQVHYYINTEERATGQGVPTWWTLPSGVSIDTNSSNAASGNNSLKAVANGSTVSKSGVVYAKPNRSYTIRAKIKTSGVGGTASLIISPDGASSFTFTSTGTASYKSNERTFTTGSSAMTIGIEMRLTGSSGTAWWDDIEVIDNTTGYPCLYNGGFESPQFGDDEFEWGVYNTIRSRQKYMSGPKGRDKAWGSGEWGLMGLNANLSEWANPKDTTKPRHDTTGIHVHNCLWAQFIACSAQNTPTYWWVTEYIIPYDLQHCWKGATTFASQLPFYDHGLTVSTDYGVAEVKATSSQSRIRVLGQKKGNDAYLWIQNKENTWANVVRAGKSPTATSATITVPGFEDGSYTVKWYNTYTGAVAGTETKTVSGGTLSLSVSSLSTDTAVIVTKSGVSTTQPQIKLVLASDKSAVVSGDIVTYSVTYTNTGTGTASNVEIKLPIPAQTTLVSGSISSGGTHETATSSVKWIIPSVAPGGSGICTVKVKVQ